MNKVAEKLIERIQALPEEEQERTAQFIMEDLDELEEVRAKIDAGVADFEAGRYSPFEGTTALINRMKRRHGLT